MQYAISEPVSVFIDDLEKAASELAEPERAKSWSPNPDLDGPNPQRLALESQADELYYGGAAGGGKTDLLLGCALMQHTRSIILRRVYPNLREIINRSIEIVGSDDDYRRGDKVWRLPGSKMLEFGAVQYEGDKSNYQGRPHDFYGFDELPEFSRTQYQFIIGWNRTTNPDQRCRVICAGNPPLDADGMWVIEEWQPWLDPEYHDPAEPGELRWYYYDNDGRIIWMKSGDPVEVDGQSIAPRSRTFIPAKLSDNPHLSVDGRYLSVLNSLPEPLRSRLRDGDFSDVKGIDPWQVIPTEWVRAAQRRWLETEKPDGEVHGVGLDIARGGRDKTAIAERFGEWFSEVTTYPGIQTPDGPTVAGLVFQQVKEPGYMNVDVIGVGSSAYDSLDTMYKNVNPVNVGQGSSYRDKSGKLKMKNLRAELYWRMRDALDPMDGDDIALPPGNEMLADLCSARYSLTAAGVVKVEAKEDIKQRLGRSPDVGDALLLANYSMMSAPIPEQPEQPSRWQPVSAGVSGESRWGRF